MAELLTIASHGTPNPNAVKFTLNRTVAAKGTTYRLPAAPGAAQAGDAASAEAPWVKQLLALEGVTQVFTLNDFVSVTKSSGTDWNVVGPKIEAILRQAFA